METVNHIYSAAVEYVQTKPIITAGIEIILFLLGRQINYNYARWLSLGPSGLPHNFAGYLMQWLILPLGDKDLTSLRPYISWRILTAYGDVAKKSYLKRSLPRREPCSQRPLVDPMWIVSQRQESGTVPIDESIRETHRNLLSSLVSESKDLRIATSRQEGHGPAIFLAEGVKRAPWAARTKGEIAHVHGIDWSGHVSLTPADTMEVVKKGWGQRHGLSYLIHISYTMVYAPRNEEQMQVVSEIYEAACAAMTDNAVRIITIASSWAFGNVCKADDLAMLVIHIRAGCLG